MLLKNTLDYRTYAFDNKVWSYFAYEENSNICDTERKLVSPYTIFNCLKIPKVCAQSYGLFNGPIYPFLMGRWKIHFGIPAEIKEVILYPAGSFYLKVKDEICFRTVSHLKTTKKNHFKEQGCSSDSGQFLDRKGFCQNCPNGSVPRLNGFTPNSPGPLSYGCLPSTKQVDSQTTQQNYSPTMKQQTYSPTIKPKEYPVHLSTVESTFSTSRPKGPTMEKPTVKYSEECVESSAGPLSCGQVMLCLVGTQPRSLFDALEAFNVFFSRQLSHFTCQKALIL